MFGRRCTGRLVRLWYMYTGLRRTDQIAVLCFIQAVTVIFIVFSTIAFMPHLITDHDTLKHLHDITDDTSESVDAGTESGNIKPRRYWLQGFEHSVAGEHVYTMYRFDQLKQYDRKQDTTPMMTDDGEYAYFSSLATYDASDTPPWFLDRRVYCNGSVMIFGTGKHVVHLKQVTIYPQFGHGKVGGEDIEDVINQKVEHEHINVEKGYFEVESPFGINVKETLSHDLAVMYEGITSKDSGFVPFHQRKRPGLVCLVVIRHEYANFYHTTMSWYDMFLTMVLFKLHPYHVEILWLDAHPSSSLDEAWHILYGSPTRAGGLTDPVKYGNMIWTGYGPRSPINLHKTEVLPYVEAYRHFVLSRFDVKDKHVINCRELRITIIWRRDHVAHPRNPTGHISRKIFDEEGVWRSVKEADYGAIVNGVQLDRLSMEEQLQLIATTDILIGMHGAGLSHVLYLPKTSAVIELFPSYISAGNAHFRAMARWRGLRYALWSNRDTSLDEQKHSTKVPKSLIQSMVKTIKESICEK